MLELVKQKQETTLEVIHNLQEVILQMLELTQEVNKHYRWKKEGKPFPFIMIYSLANGFVKEPSPDAYSIPGFNDTDERIPPITLALS